jgi:hypothetical protein
VQAAAGGLLGTTGAPCGAGTGGGNTTSTSLATNALSKANGTNAIVNSSLSDDGTTVSTSEPIHASAFVTPSGGSGTPGITLGPTATATSGANYGSVPLNLQFSYYNAGAVTDSWTYSTGVGSGATPYSALDFTGPSTLPVNDSVLFGISPSVSASSSANFDSPALLLRGAYYNGSASAPDTWYVQDVLGSGTNPYSALTFTHSGTSGAANFTVPGLQIAGAPAGCAQFASNGVISSTGSPCPLTDVSISIPSFAIPANTCYGSSGSTTPATVTMTGLPASGLQITWGFSSDPSSINGWGGVGGLSPKVWDSAANTASYLVCNSTAVSITGGAITLILGAK